MVLVSAVAVAYLLLGSTNSPAGDPIAQAATLSSGTPGYRMNLAMTMSSQALSAPITASGSAIVDLRDQSMSMSIGFDMSQIPRVAQALGSGVMRMQMILVHRVMYMRLPSSLTRRVPQLDGKPWLKLNLTKASGLPGLSSLGNNPTMTNPSEVLQYLRAASDSVSDEGSQLVGGFPTTHYHVLLDLNKVAANLPAAEQVAVQNALSVLRSSTNLQQIPVDVWVDARHLVRRIGMVLAVTGSGGQQIQEATTADFTDYGPQPQASPPPADRVQDLANLIHVSF